MSETSRNVADPPYCWPTQMIFFYRTGIADLAAKRRLPPMYG